MRNKRIRQWTALLLAALMLVWLPAPATFAAAPDDADAALEKTFSYYQNQQGGVLTGWEDLAAAHIAGEDLTEYSLPQTPTTTGAALLFALIKGDAERAKVLANGLTQDLESASYAYGDALELIAIEVYNRTAASDINYDRAKAIDCLLMTQETDGGFGFGAGGDPDTTGLALAALAAFNTGAYPKVQDSVQKALQYLKNAQQQSNGGFSGAWSGNNANSAAVVLWGLCALKESPDNWTVANGKTPLDALLSFQTATGGFGVTDQSADDPFATPQAALALAQVAKGKSLLDIGLNPVSYRSLSVGVVDASGAYHERSVTAKSSDTLSDVITRAMRATKPAVSSDDYYCYKGGAPFDGDIADGAKLLAIHKNFEKVAYFKTKDTDGIGVNATEIPFGSSVTLTLVSTSAGAIAPESPLAGIGTDVDGDGFSDGVTDADGSVTLGFIDAGTYSVFALPGGALDADTAVLPAKVTMSGGSAQTAAVSVRVEGVSDNILFKSSLRVGNSGEKILTVLDAVKDALETGENPIPYTESGGYISSIDGVAAGTGGEGNDGTGWDGWLYTIASDEYLKGEKTLSGMASQPIADGDEIVVYYGNSDYSTAFPAVGVALNTDRSVTVTVKTWPTYGQSSEPSPAENVSVSWAKNTVFAYTGLTDKNGALVIPADKAPTGRHTLQIDKTGKFGLPDIVRLAPGYAVNVTKESASPQAPETKSDEVYIKVTGPSGTLFVRKGFSWYRGVTPLALLRETGLSHETDAAGAYVSSIGGVKEFDYGPNSGWLYKVNGVETIKESAAAYKLNAGDELEWFYTSDYTKESGSSAWSSAPAGEGAATAALQPEAEAKNGAAEIKLSDEDVKKVVSEALRDGASEIVIAPKITGEANKVSVELSAAAARGIANDTTAGLALKTSLGDMSISHAGLAALTEEGSGQLTLSIERNAGLISAIVALDGKAVRSVEGGVKLRVPLADAEGAPSAGTVAILVREDGSEEVILLSKVTADGIIAVLDGSATIRTEDRSRAFDDVRESAWYKDDAAFVSARALFRGTGENEFSGDIPMTRAMLAAVFHRLAGSPASEGSAFPDVPDAAWYREAAKWASDNGIVRGAEGNFAGNSEITREQLAAMAMRFAASVDADMGRPEELSGFTDDTEVSAWAEESVKWAVGADLLKGDGGLLKPGGLATRAEVAAIMRRFIENWTEAL
jgi:hypothetical protein